MDMESANSDVNGGMVEWWKGGNFIFCYFVLESYKNYKKMFPKDKEPIYFRSDLSFYNKKNWLYKGYSDLKSKVSFQISWLYNTHCTPCTLHKTQNIVSKMYKPSLF